MVDLISNGRVGLAFDAGRNVDEVASTPNTGPDRRALMHRQVDQIRALWRSRGSSGPHRFAAPTRSPALGASTPAELPVWVAASAHPQSFADAGRAGVNVLTHLVNTGPQDLADQVRGYRKGRAAAGLDAAGGVVTVLQHTFVSDEPADVRAATADLVDRSGIEPPFGRSTRSDGDSRPAMPGAHEPVVTPVLHGPPRRYAEEHALLGSVAGCAGWVRQLAEAGVDEIACVVDFVTDPDLLRRGLPGLAALRRACAGPERTDPVHLGPDRFMGWG